MAKRREFHSRKMQQSFSHPLRRGVLLKQWHSSRKPLQSWQGIIKSISTPDSARDQPLGVEGVEGVKALGS